MRHPSPLRMPTSSSTACEVNEGCWSASTLSPCPSDPGGIFDVVSAVIPELGFRSDQDDKSKEWEGSCHAETTLFAESLKRQVSLDEAVFFCIQIHDPNDESITNLVSLVTEAKEMYLYCPEKLLRREPLLSLLDLAEEMSCPKVHICIPRDSPDAPDMIKSFLYFGFSLHPSNLSDYLTLTLNIDS